MRIAGIETGPISGPPPPVSADTVAELLAASKKDPLGQHEGGKDGDDVEDEGKGDEKVEGRTFSFFQGSCSMVLAYIY